MGVVGLCGEARLPPQSRMSGAPSKASLVHGGGRSYVCECADTFAPQTVRLQAAGRLAPNALRKAQLDIMENAKRPQGFRLLGSTPWPGLHAGAAARKRAKRNPWVVVTFFALVIVAWINSQM